jgi:hypothetical protein
MKQKDINKAMTERKGYRALCFAAAFFALLASCDEPKEWDDPKDSSPPGPVTNIEVENLNGGARFYYALPAEPDILGAKVVYQLVKDGEYIEKYSTTDTLEIEGYGDTEARTVTLYAVDRSNNISEGVEVEIAPLTPYIENIRRTMTVDAAFGGIKTAWDNSMRKDMSISLYLPDSASGEWALYDTYFSNDPIGVYVFRPFDAEPQQFRFELRDRWDNYATPMDTLITPLFEQQIYGRIDNVDIFSQFGDADGTWRERGDIHNADISPVNTRPFNLLYDNVWVPADASYWHPGWGMTIADYAPGLAGPIPFPLYFTFDMGKQSVYSRINITSRLRSPNYSADIPCKFEIWGTNSPQGVTPGDRMGNLAFWTSWAEVGGTDAWKEGWTKLANCEIILSSGTGKYTDGMALSESDLDKYRVSGFDFDMDEGVFQPFRYLRFVVLGTNTNAKALTLREIRFWGAYAE